MFLFSPHYAQYIIWLVPFFTLMPNLPILTYLLGFLLPLHCSSGGTGPKMFLANEILYAAPCAAAFVIQMILRQLARAISALFVNQHPRANSHEHSSPNSSCRRRPR